VVATTAMGWAGTKPRPIPHPKHDVHVGFITYPANTNALVALVSFGASGIYLSFLLTVIGSIIARRRGRGLARPLHDEYQTTGAERM